MRRAETKVRPSFLYVLSFLGLGICIASSLGYQIQHVPVGTPFGLFGVLPAAFWVGMGLMVLSMALSYRSGSERLFFVQATLIFVALWGIPTLFEKYPSIWDSYMHYNSSLEIARLGAVPDDPTFSYAYNYPGFFVLGASYAVLSEPNALLFLKLYPLFAAALTLAAIYLFVRTYIPGADHRLVFIVAAFANVWLQFNYSPQSLGLVAGLLIFVTLEREGTEWRMAALALFAFVVISHPTTLIFVLGAVLAKEVFSRLYRATIARKRPMRWDRPWPVGIFILIWLGWFFTGASSFSLNLTQFIAERLQYLGTTYDTVTNQYNMRASPENILGALYPQLRTGAVVVFVLMTVAALIVYLVMRKRSPVSIPRNIVPLFVLPFLIIPLDTLFFNGQLYDRGILYLMIVAPLIFIPIILRRGSALRPVIAAALLILVVLSASTMYYQETLYINNDEAMAASTYLSGQAPPSYVIGGYYPYDVWSAHGEDYMRIKASSVYNQTTAQFASYSGGGTYLFDDTTELWYRQWGISDIYYFYADQAPLNYKVYDNGAYWVMFVPEG